MNYAALSVCLLVDAIMLDLVGGTKIRQPLPDYNNVVGMNQQRSVTETLKRLGS